MESKVYNQEGGEVGVIKLPEGIFGVPWNADLVHQVVTSVLSGRRSPVAHVKARGEVRGGGRKPWRQKGTGRARHGSIRSPIWVGGGVAHGPRKEKNFYRKVNKKMKAKTLAVVLSKKLEEGELVFVDSIELSEMKTKNALGILQSVASAAGVEKTLSKKRNGFCVELPVKDKIVEKSFANLGNVSIQEIRNINPVDILSCKCLILVSPENCVKFLESKILKSK